MKKSFLILAAVMTFINVSGASAENIKLLSSKELIDNAYLTAGAGSKAVGANLGYVINDGWTIGMDMGFKRNDDQIEKASLNTVEATRTEAKNGMSPAVLLGLGYKF